MSGLLGYGLYYIRYVPNSIMPYIFLVLHVVHASDQPWKHRLLSIGNRSGR